MALTNEEKQELLNAMKAESQGVDELEQVDTLDGRLCFYMLPHDLDIRRFRDELMRYGLSEEENEIRKFLNKVFKEKGLTNYPDQASPDEEEDEE
jgi:DNA-binding MarR family transcriptional regulator